MYKLVSRVVVLLVVAFSCSALIAQRLAPTVRIAERIDETQLVTLKGNTHPAANAKNDRGKVSGNLPMTDMIMVLSRDSAQQAAFDKFVASQYDPNSANFHQWLTPEQVGENFGPSQTDIATIMQWLTGHGFSVANVSNDRMAIRFGGTAAQVENAFHTEIHNLDVRGVHHIGNMSDPQIPAALAPVVVGIKSLHDFFPRPQHRMGQVVQRDAETGKWLRAAGAGSSGSGLKPSFVTTDQYGDIIEDVAPYDFATIYNLLPLWNASTAIDGTGQQIAVVGTSDINPADVAAFRSDFGLPAGPTPIQVKGANGTDPGICTNDSATCSIDDLIENSLDVEWSGSIARNAQIVLVTSGSNSATDDTIYDSASFIIKNLNQKLPSPNSSVKLTAQVINVSYGECELGEGTAGNVSYYNLWQTASTEGIAVFVASGDAGSAACDQGLDSSTPYAAAYGLSVNALASTPWNTAVGGTDLYWCSVSNQWNGTCSSSAAEYWNTSNSSTNSNAKGYVVEVPWNDTCASPLGFQFAQQIANYAGFSGINDAETGCNFAANIQDEEYVYEETGIDMSTLVDIVGGGGGASGCVVNGSTDTTTGTCTAGSTSTGSANGSIPLYNNGWVKPSWQTGVPGIPTDGVRDIPDVSFFASDGFLGSSYLICVSEGGYSCTYSDKAEPFAQEVGGTSVATPAMAGVMALINQKLAGPQGSPNQELYALGAKQATSPGYSSCSAETVTTSSSCYFNDIDAGPFTPAYNNATPCVVGVSPNCTAVDSGDSVAILSGYSAGTGYDQATGLGSLNIANVVNNWTSSVGKGATTVTVTPTPSTISVNQSLSVAVTVAATSGATVPTGSVILSGGGYTSSAEQLSSGAYTFTVPANSLSGGVDPLSVSYGGDSNFAPSSGSSSVTVTKLTATVSAMPSAASINSNQSVTVTGTVSPSAGGPTPTGTVYVTFGSYTSSAATLSSGQYSVTIAPNSLAGGTDTLTVQYSGDVNYSATMGSTSVMVTYVPVLTPTVTVTPATMAVDSGSPLTVTVSVTGSGATPTGNVTLTAQGTQFTATQTLSNATTTFTIPANTLSSSPTAVVTDTLTANYQGDANYAQANGSAQVSVTQSAYSLSATTPPAISAGSSASSTITVNSSSDYTGTLTFTNSSCVLTSSPSGAVSLPTCALNGNGTVTMTDGSASGTVAYTVNTTAASTASAADRPALHGTAGDAQWAKSSPPVHGSRSTGWFGAAGTTAFCALLVFFIPRRSRRWRAMLCMLIAVAAVSFALAGCGGSSNNGGGGTQATPTVAVTVTPGSVTLGSNTMVSVAIAVSGSSGTPTGSVSFSGGGYTSTSQTLSGGSYTYSVPASSFTTVGSDTLTASYSGDTNYTSGSGTATLTVNNIPTTSGNYTFTVTPTSSPTSTAAPPSAQFTVTVN